MNSVYKISLGKFSRWVDCFYNRYYTDLRVTRVENVISVLNAEDGTGLQHLIYLRILSKNESPKTARKPIPRRLVGRIAVSSLGHRARGSENALPNVQFPMPAK